MAGKKGVGTMIALFSSFVGSGATREPLLTQLEIAERSHEALKLLLPRLAFDLRDIRSPSKALR